MLAWLASQPQAKEQARDQQVRIVNQNPELKNQPGRDSSYRQQYAPYQQKQVARLTTRSR